MAKIIVYGFNDFYLRSYFPDDTKDFKISEDDEIIKVSVHNAWKWMRPFFEGLVEQKYARCKRVLNWNNISCRQVNKYSEMKYYNVRLIPAIGRKGTIRAVVFSDEAKHFLFLLKYYKK